MGFYEQIMRLNETFCIIWYQLDNFKKVNNTFGGVLRLGKLIKVTLHERFSFLFNYFISYHHSIIQQEL